MSSAECVDTVRHMHAPKYVSETAVARRVYVEFARHGTAHCVCSVQVSSTIRAALQRVLSVNGQCMQVGPRLCGLFWPTMFSVVHTHIAHASTSQIINHPPCTPTTHAG